MVKPQKQTSPLEHRQMLERMPVALLRSDQNGKIIYANAAARRLLGDRVLHKNANDLYGPTIGQSPVTPQSIKAELLHSRSRRLTNVTIPMKLADGTIQEVLCSFVLDRTTATIDGLIVPGVIELNRALARIADSLNKRHNRLEEILRVITVEARMLCQATRAYIKIHDPERNVLVFKALSSDDQHEQFPEESASIHRGMTGHVFHTRELYRSGNVRKEPPETYFCIFSDTISKAVVPLLYNDEQETTCFGILSIDGRRENQFGIETEDILKTLANHASIAVAQVRLLDEVRDLSQQLFEGINPHQEHVSILNILHDGKNMVRDVVYELRSIRDDFSKTAFGRKKAKHLDVKLETLQDLNDLMQDLLEQLRGPVAMETFSSEDDCVELYLLAKRVINLIPLAGASIEVNVKATKGCQYLFYGKATKVLRILYNLLTNAVTAIKRAEYPGEINILLSPTPKRSGFCRMQVVDNGPGLQKSALKFIREGAMLSHTGGTGLGLLAVREAVRELGGAFSVDSKFGDGTKITIDLPGQLKEESV